MKGLDTSVLVRFLVDAEGDPMQHEIAARYLQTHCTADAPCHISGATLCELAWVLQRSYGVSRTGIADHVSALLDVQQLTVAERDVVRKALVDYRKGNADFSDHLKAWQNKVAGCEGTATFDKNAGKQPLFEYIG